MAKLRCGKTSKKFVRQPQRLICGINAGFSIIFLLSAHKRRLRVAVESKPALQKRIRCANGTRSAGSQPYLASSFMRVKRPRTRTPAGLIGKTGPREPGTMVFAVSRFLVSAVLHVSGNREVGL